MRSRPFFWFAFGPVVLQILLAAMLGFAVVLLDALGSVPTDSERSSPAISRPPHIRML